jgi:integrase
MRADFGSPEFQREYQAAITGAAKTQGKSPESIGTLAWLIARYRESAAWQTLSLSTRRQREAIFLHVLEKAGANPFDAITQAVVNAGVERRAGTPSAARHFLDSLRGLFRWALRANLSKVDPTLGVTTKRKSGGGYPPWTEEYVTAYQARWSLGSRQRVWLDILLYTGLRVGDAYRLSRQHIAAGEMKTEKTGAIVYPQITPVLAKTIAAGPVGEDIYIISGNGKPFTSKGAFGNAFVTAAKAAGVPASAHGVRKLAATRAANRGASEAMLEATYGWSGGRMASLYTRSADRKRLAGEAHKLAR